MSDATGQSSGLFAIYRSSNFRFVLDLSVSVCGSLPLRVYDIFIYCNPFYLVD